MKKFIAIIALISCFVNVWGQCDVQTYGNIQLGSGGGGFNWDDKTTTLLVDRHRPTLTFSYATLPGWAVTGCEYRVYEIINGESKQVWQTDEKKGTASIQLSEVDPGVKHYVKLVYSGNFGATYKDITFTQKESFQVDNTSAIQFGDIQFGQTVSAAIPVTYSAMRGDVSCNNSAFTLSPNTYVGAEHCEYGTSQVVVNFTAKSIGAQTATVRIGEYSIPVSVNVLLGVPQNLRAENITANSFVAKWDAVAGADTYVFEWADANKNAINNGTPTTINYFVDGLAPYTTYYMRVKAISDNNESAYTEWVEVKTLLATPDVAVESITAIGFKAAWNKVNNATGYTVELTDANKANPEEHTVTTWEKSFADLAANTSYHVRVKATADGNESAYSPYVEVLTLLATPANLQIDPAKVEPTGFELTWNEVPGAVRYKVSLMGELEECTDPAFTFTGLKEGTTYSCQVQAVSADNKNDSDFSQTIEVTTPYAGIARIGGTSYPTLNEAIGKFAENDEEVVLLGDVNESIDITDVVRLNAQGYTIGNVTVENTGNLLLTGSVEMENLLIKASADTAVVSGQISKTQSIDVTIHGEAALQKEICIDVIKGNKWYAFSVPFKVNSDNGFFDKEGNKLTNNTHYWLNKYDGQRRADYGLIANAGPKCSWQYTAAGEILEPGKGYMVWVDSDKYRYLRMKAVNNEDVFADNVTVQAQKFASETGLDATHEGWNYLANPYLCNAKVAGVQKVQVLADGGSNHLGTKYTTVNAADITFELGSSFIAQVQDDAAITINKANANVSLRSIDTELPFGELKLLFGATGDTNLDALFVGLSQNAQNQYEKGKDLTKLGSITTYNSLWVEAYGHKLSVFDAKLSNNEAFSNLFLNMVANGTYQLQLASQPANATVWLLKEGEMIHNLSQAPYVFEGAKGTAEYALYVQVTSDYEEDNDDVTTSLTAPAKAQPIVYCNNGTLVIDGAKENDVYTVFNGSMAYAQGVCVNQPVTVVLPQKGIYFVKVGTTVVKVLNL